MRQEINVHNLQHTWKIGRNNKVLCSEQDMFDWKIFSCLSDVMVAGE